MRFLIYIISILSPFIIDKLFKNFIDNYLLEIFIIICFISITYELSIRLYKCNKQIKDVSSFTNINNLISDKIQLEKKANLLIETLKKDKQLENFKEIVKKINRKEPFSENNRELDYFFELDLIEFNGHFYNLIEDDTRHLKKLKFTEKGILIKDNI